MDAATVLKFWFEELTSKDRFKKDPKLDQTIGDLFGACHARAIRGELFGWRKTPQGRLAEIIVLDQFSRNMFRDRKESFAFDTLALVLAQEAIASHADRALPLDQRGFVYMPFMHSESKVIHEEALQIFNQEGLEGMLDYERRHKEIIDRFGRYPHRNRILGRISTAEEEAFLQTPGSSF